MKKYVLLIIAMLTIGHLSAQVKIDDFESGDNGWTRVSCGGDLIENPYKTGINLSNHVYRAVRSPDCDNWSGAMVNNKVYTGYKYVHAYMYRNNNGTPNVKVSDNPEKDFAPMNAIVANQWQDVVFDISDYETSGTEFIFFMVDRGTLTEDAWMLIDEVQLSNDATPRTAVVGGGNVEPNPEIITDGEWTLKWNEEFTGEALDTQVWNIEVNGDGGGNNELQYYCEKGVSIGTEPTSGKKCLILTATKESYNGRGCTSGRVNTKHNMYYTYGKIEARIKFPSTANGLWPAFWQLGENIDDVGWPKCGETDIIEMGHQNGINNGTQNRFFNGAMHVGRAWDAVWQDVNNATWSYSLQDEFHILTMIWTPTSIDMYMDKDAHPELSAYFHADLETNADADYNRKVVFGKPNFVVANLAVGGNFPGIYNINNITALTNGPRSMYIDWIRIYQRGETNESFACPSVSDPIESGDYISTGCVQIQKDNAQSVKILRNGQLLIRRGGHIYTITGQIVQ